MPGIGVVLNPHSKRYKKDPSKMKQIGFIVGEKASFEPTVDLRDVHRVAEKFKAKEIDILALTGGDGTNHRTLTTFIKVYQDQPLPKIAFLKGGTLNTAAHSCGIKGSPEGILSNVLYKYHEDESFKMTQLQLMKINDSYGFIWGCGVIYRFMAAYYGRGDPSPLSAGMTLVRSVTSALFNGPFASKLFRRFNGQVRVDGKVWPFRNYSAIYAGSVVELGLNFKVFHHAQELGKFHSVAFSLPPRNVLRYVPAMFMGRDSRCPDLIEEPAQEMVVELEKPLPYTIDGDMHDPCGHFHLTPGPRLDVIVE
jgi:diacylglycerol kinase (ATP)